MRWREQRAGMTLAFLVWTDVTAIAVRKSAANIWLVADARNRPTQLAEQEWASTSLESR